MQKAINQSILVITLLLLALGLLGVIQISHPQPAQRRMWPVEKLPTRSPTVADIEFIEFEFEQLSAGRHGPTPASIQEQPSKGAQYFVQPILSGENAIATIKFEAIDEHGATIADIPMIAHNGPGGRPDFIGVMQVPDRPFRVVVSGKAVDGREYRIIYPSLFVPTNEPVKWEWLIPPGTSRNDVKKMRNEIEKLLQESVLKIRKEFEKLPGGVIVMPRTRVFNVNYAPIFSPSGQPRGVRITYEVEFSQDGHYDPALLVFPDYKNEEWRGKIQMNVLDLSIDPKPVDESTQVQPHALADDASYIYRTGTTYRFRAELFPSYVIQNKEKTNFCLITQESNLDPRQRAVWEEILASKEPVTYRVDIGNSDFAGVIENFYPQQTLYDGFIADGARNCPAQPMLP